MKKIISMVLLLALFVSIFATGTENVKAQEVFEDPEPTTTNAKEQAPTVIDEDGGYPYTIDGTTLTITATEYAMVPNKSVENGGIEGTPVNDPVPSCGQMVRLDSGEIATGYYDGTDVAWVQQEFECKTEDMPAIKVEGHMGDIGYSYAISGEWKNSEKVESYGGHAPSDWVCGSIGADPCLGYTSDLPDCVDSPDSCNSCHKKNPDTGAVCTRRGGSLGGGMTPSCGWYMPMIQSRFQKLYKRTCQEPKLEELLPEPECELFTSQTIEFLQTDYKKGQTITGSIFGGDTPTNWAVETPNWKPELVEELEWTTDNRTISIDIPSECNPTFCPGILVKTSNDCDVKMANLEYKPECDCGQRRNISIAEDGTITEIDKDTCITGADEKQFQMCVYGEWMNYEDIKADDELRNEAFECGGLQQPAIGEEAIIDITATIISGGTYIVAKNGARLTIKAALKKLEEELLAEAGEGGATFLERRAMKKFEKAAIKARALEEKGITEGKKWCKAEKELEAAGDYLNKVLGSSAEYGKLAIKELKDQIKKLKKDLKGKAKDEKEAIRKEIKELKTQLKDERQKLKEYKKAEKEEWKAEKEKQKEERKKEKEAKEDEAFSTMTPEEKMTDILGNKRGSKVKYQPGDDGGFELVTKKTYEEKSKETGDVVTKELEIKIKGGAAEVTMKNEFEGVPEEAKELLEVGTEYINIDFILIGDPAHASKMDYATLMKAYSGLKDNGEFPDVIHATTTANDMLINIFEKNGHLPVKPQSPYLEVLAEFYEMQVADGIAPTPKIVEQGGTYEEALWTYVILP